MSLMQIGAWDALFNILLLLFWFGFWNQDDRSLVFNQYLSPLGRLTDGTARFLRPAAFGLPDRWLLLAAFVFFLALRGMAVPRSVRWVLAFGFEVRMPDPVELVQCMAFTALSFGLLLFKLWGITLLYVRDGRAASAHTTGALHALSRPFSEVPARFRPLALLAWGMALALLLNVFGHAPPGLPAPGASGAAGVLRPVVGIRYMLSSLAAFAGVSWPQLGDLGVSPVGVLSAIGSFLILLIIGSWVSMLTGSQALMFFCRDWIDMLLGPFRRYPLRVGMFDLTPLVFFFGLAFLQGILAFVLFRAYLSVA